MFFFSGGEIKKRKSLRGNSKNVNPEFYKNESIKFTKRNA